MRRFSRRGVLHGLALLPFLPSLRASAQTATPTPPRRFLVFFHPNGILPSEWFPTQVTSDTAFTLGGSMAPLAPHKDLLLVTQGIDMKCTAPGPGEPHQRGMAAFLTGRHLLEGNQVGGDGSLAGYGSGQSIDQRIAQVIGKTTKYGSVQLGIRAGGGDVRHHLNYSGSNQPLPVQSSPKAAYDLMVSALNLSVAEREGVRTRRTSVLDAVRGQLSSVSASLPSAERSQLDQHLTLIRDMEARLSATAGASCTLPASPAALDPNNAATMQTISRLQIDLMVTLMACDLTRVGTLQYSQAQNHITFPWLQSDIDGHALSHVGNSDPVRADIGKRDRWYAGELAYLLEKLKTTREGDGYMIDNTLILWGNELAEGNSHSHVNMPFVLAGKGANVRTGRFLKYTNASHNDLLVSVLRSYGIDDATFGNPDFCKGPLAGIA